LKIHQTAAKQAMGNSVVGVGDLEEIPAEATHQIDDRVEERDRLSCRREHID